MQRADNKEHMQLSGGTFTMPRLLRTAPNGDIFVADSGAGAILILRGVGADGKVLHVEKFAVGLDHPFGIAFTPKRILSMSTSEMRQLSNGFHITREICTRQTDRFGGARLAQRWVEMAHSAKAMTVRAASGV